MIANAFRLAIFAASSILVGQCWHWSLNHMLRAVRWRVTGLGVIAGALMVGTINALGRPWNWGLPFLLIGLIVAVRGMSMSDR